MNRRGFLAGSLAAAAWSAVPASEDVAASGALHPCLNEATTLNAPFDLECAAYAAAGFRRIELWFPKLAGQHLTASEVAASLRHYQLEPVSACASGVSTWRGPSELESQLADHKKNFELAQALGVPRYVDFCNFDGPAQADDYKLLAERLASLAELARNYGVRIAFEFIARSALAGSLATSLAVIREARQPNLAVCLDTFHFFAGISKLEDLDLLAPGDVEHVHFHDVPGAIPRERLTDPDRIPPGEGVIPLKRITAVLARIGYSGSLSTELFGERYQKGDPKEVASRCYRALAPFCGLA